jgi:uncharacterized RDD family membrane protein YckC
VYCSKCGVNLAAGAAFCGSCGTPTGTPAAAIARPSVPPSYVGGSSHAAYADPAGLVVSRGFTYAGFWLRLVASLIDGVIMGLAAGVLLVPVFILTGMGTHLDGLAARGGRPDPAILIGFFGMILVFAAVSTLIQWLYHAYLESGETQATWGKQALGLYVTDLMGNPITFGRASGRFFAKIVTGMIPLGIGYIMAGFTERKQALHDMIASCLVLRR